jgi:hypothetical protein
MTRPQLLLTGLLGLAGLIWANPASVQAQPPPSKVAPPSTDKMEKLRAAANVPLAAIPEKFREDVRLTVEKATLFTQGPVEAFACQPAVYYWLLQHPDRGVLAWRRLGAQCVMISERGPGRFGWTDEHGSDLQWETVYASNDRHIWYAEGKVRPGLLLPLVSVKALVVLRFAEQDGQVANGGKMMQHQADMFLYTDSTGAALAAKLFGAAAPRMAEQCVSQMETFFSGMAWFVHRYPERAAGLFGSSSPADSASPVGHGVVGH